MAGANLVVLLRNGASIRGLVETIDENILVLRATEDGLTRRSIVEEEIVCLARRVGKSTTARAWLGALIGATASLSFGISMVGDMMMPAAIGGALVAVGYLLGSMQSDKAAFARYFHACLEAGVYFAPSQFEAGFLSLAHTPDDLARTASVVAAALAK